MVSAKALEAANAPPSHATVRAWEGNDASLAVGKQPPAVRTFGWLLLVGLLSGVQGCMVHHVDEHPRAPIRLPDRFEKSMSGAERSDRTGQWWKSFGDPELDELIEQALGGNFQLQQAWARLEQAQAVAAGAGAGLSPRIDARASAGKQKRVMSLGGPRPLSFTTATYDLSLPVSYELDLWGKVRAGKKAAAIEAQASRDDLEAAAMTVAATVAETWFSLVEQKATARLLREQKHTNEAFLQLVRLRFAQGQASATEVLQQKQQVDATEARLTMVKGQIQVLQEQLAVLVGKPPGSFSVQAPEQLPDLPPVPAAGIPSDLLELRPDVRAARRRVVAADYRVAQAIAARYPSLQLSESFGYSAPKLSDLLDSFVWSVMASLTGNIWDGGRMAAEVDRNRAMVRMHLYAYAQKLLDAMLEVRKALVLEKHRRLHLRQLQAQTHTAQQALDIARDRYRQGLTDFLPVLTTLRSLQAAQTAELSARRQLVSTRIQLYRALGGTWTSQLQQPTDEQQQERQP